MSTAYTINPSNPNAEPFVILPMTTNGPAHPSSDQLDDRAVQANSSVRLVGKGLESYGQPIMQSIFNILENFASPIEPSYATPGQLWYKSDVEQMFVYTGTVWKNVQFTTSFANLDMAGYQIKNVGNATANGDAVSRSYGDSRYLRLTGGVVTGLISVATAPTSGNHLTNKTYVDSLYTAVYNKTQSDARYLQLSGGTITGLLSVTQAPVAANNVITKGYVDDATAAIANNTYTKTAADDKFIQNTGGTIAGPLSVVRLNVNETITIQNFVVAALSDNFNYAIAPNQHGVVIDGVGAFTAGEVVFPTTPVNNRIITIAFAQDVTALTMTSAATIIAPLTSATAGSFATWLFNTTMNTWYRIG